MQFPKISPVDKVLYGGGAIAAAGAYWGFKRDTENEATGDKVKAGIAKAGLVTAAGMGAYAYGPKRIAGQVWRGGRSYARNMSTGLPGWQRYATAPVMMGAGAAIGAMVAGEDHRGKGAVIGAGAGAAAGAIFHGAKAWGRMGAFGKFGLMAGISAAAFGAGEKSSREQAQMAAVADPETGETEYVTPEAARQFSTGASRRMRNMRASGEMVFGLNNSRRG